jgi:hypothetical protein
MKTRSFASLALAWGAGCLVACGDAPLPGGSVVVDAGTVDAGKDAAVVDASGPKDAAPTDGGPSEAGPCTNRTYANFGQAWLQSRCNACHGTVEPKLTSRELLLQHLEAVKTSIGAGTMPPPPTTLPSSEKSIALQWLACGAP